MELTPWLERQSTITFAEKDTGHNLITKDGKQSNSILLKAICFLKYFIAAI
jgi:hypothetical protein